LIGLREFFEREARDLDDYVVYRRLERGRRVARDVVRYLVERVTDGELGRNLGYGESGRLRRERRATGHARVHLYDHHAPVFGVNAELDVRAPCIDAYLSYYRDRRISETLVFLVGERLSRGYGYAVPGVNTHRVEI